LAQRSWLLAAVSAALLLAAVAARPPRLPEELAEWPRGAVRWLLLPDEADAFEHLQSAEEARAFIVAFWARRDPAAAAEKPPPRAAAPPAPAPPADPVALPRVNAFAARFFERVAMADKLYLEEDVRGSLTDRGGALILLGPPPVMRVLRRKVPALASSRPGRAGEVLEVPIEVWAYRPADLPDLARLEPKLGEDHEITLTFRAGGAHVTLLDGRSILRLAARAAVERP
jgi:GWxTD domain-containing protein